MKNLKIGHTKLKRLLNGQLLDNKYKLCQVGGIKDNND
jgi:hypothetical protein